MTKITQILKKTYPYPAKSTDITKLSHFRIIAWDYNWRFPFYFDEMGKIMSGEYLGWHITDVYTTTKMTMHTYIALYLTILELSNHPINEYDQFQQIIHAAAMVNELHIKSVVIKRKSFIETIQIQYTQSFNYTMMWREPPLINTINNAANHFYFPSFTIIGNETWMKREIDRLFVLRDTFKTIHFHLNDNPGGENIPVHLILRCLCGSREPWMKDISKVMQNKEIYTWDCWNEENIDNFKKLISSLNLEMFPINQPKFAGKIIVHMTRDNGSAAWFFITYLVYAFGGKVNRIYRTMFNQKYKFGRIADPNSQLTLKGISSTTSGDGNAESFQINSKIRGRCPTEQFLTSSVRNCDWNMFWTE
jgi:hypothetical protein